MHMKQIVHTHAGKKTYMVTKRGLVFDCSLTSVSLELSNNTTWFVLVVGCHVATLSFHSSVTSRV